MTWGWRHASLVRQLSVTQLHTLSHVLTGCAQYASCANMYSIHAMPPLCQSVPTGPVEKVKVYHTNPEGIVTIKFHDQPAAEQVFAGSLQPRTVDQGYKVVSC